LCKKTGGMNSQMPLKPAIKWDEKLKRFPGETNKETIELLKEEHTWVGIGRMLGCQGQTVSKYYNRLLSKKPVKQPAPRVRNGKRVDYLKELKKFMGTAKGDLVREYNRIVIAKGR